MTTNIRLERIDEETNSPNLGQDLLQTMEEIEKELTANQQEKRELEDTLDQYLDTIQKVRSYTSKINDAITKNSYVRWLAAASNIPENELKGLISELNERIQKADQIPHIKRITETTENIDSQATQASNHSFGEFLLPNTSGQDPHFDSFRSKIMATRDLLDDYQAKIRNLKSRIASLENSLSLESGKNAILRQQQHQSSSLTDDREQTEAHSSMEEEIQKLELEKQRLESERWQLSAEIEELRPCANELVEVRIDVQRLQSLARNREVVYNENLQRSSTLNNKLQSEKEVLNTTVSSLEKELRWSVSWEKNPFLFVSFLVSLPIAFYVLIRYFIGKLSKLFKGKKKGSL